MATSYLTLNELDNLVNEIFHCINHLNPLSTNPEKWSNTLKQIVGKLPTICLSVFDHFMNLALKVWEKAAISIAYINKL